MEIKTGEKIRIGRLHNPVFEIIETKSGQIEIVGNFQEIIKTNVVIISIFIKHLEKWVDVLNTTPNSQKLEANSEYIKGVGIYETSFMDKTSLQSARFQIKEKNENESTKIRLAMIDKLDFYNEADVFYLDKNRMKEKNYKGKKVESHQHYGIKREPEIITDSFNRLKALGKESDAYLEVQGLSEFNGLSVFGYFENSLLNVFVEQVYPIKTVNFSYPSYSGETNHIPVQQEDRSSPIPGNFKLKVEGNLAIYKTDENDKLILQKDAQSQLSYYTTNQDYHQITYLDSNNFAQSHQPYISHNQIIQTPDLQPPKIFRLDIL